MADQEDPTMNDDVSYDLRDLRRFEMLRNAARTRRCHTQMVLHQQTVGEHTFSALAILDLVAPDCRMEVWRALLYHDMPEAFTGDVPAPAKWENFELENALRTVEARIFKELGLEFKLSAEEKKLVKFADVMDLVWFTIEEVQMGNQRLVGMAHRALDAVRERKLMSLSPRTLKFYDYTCFYLEQLGWEPNRYQGRDGNEHRTDTNRA
jgi:5'-deoxynucleotidase YfbR-like HD superfamily hydrolase